MLPIKNLFKWNARKIQWKSTTQLVKSGTSWTPSSTITTLLWFSIELSFLHKYLIWCILNCKFHKLEHSLIDVFSKWNVVKVKKIINTKIRINWWKELTFWERKSTNRNIFLYFLTNSSLKVQYNLIMRGGQAKNIKGQN